MSINVIVAPTRVRAGVDYKFNVQMDKVQQAVIGLERVATQFGKDFKPVDSQIRALEISARDLNKLSDQLKAIK